MLSGYYTIASGLLTRQREIDTVGNNLINADTPGYRGDRLLISSFEQELLTRQEANSKEVLSDAGAATVARVEKVVSLLQPGTIKQTGRTCDVALAGQGFFQVRGDNGTTYLTRNGQFDLDSEGYLVLPGIGRVIGNSSGPIKPGSGEFTVDTNGSVYNAGGKLVDTLRIVSPPENATVQKLENGLFIVNGNTRTLAQNEVNVVQKSVELSNMDYNQEMTLLIEAQRAFQTCSAALQIEDGLNRKAIQIAAI